MITRLGDQLTTNKKLLFIAIIVILFAIICSAIHEYEMAKQRYVEYYRFEDHEA